MRIRSSRVWVISSFLACDLIIENGKIIAVEAADPAVIPDIDYGDLRIVPGFIDIHTHGAYGFDTNYADPEGLRKWARGVVSEGVTGFLATTVTDAKETLLKAVKNVNAVASQDYEGARILGIHLEGPYLDMNYKGAQPPEAIVPPSVKEFREYQEASGNRIRIITLAPEHDSNFELTHYCRDHGVIVSMGHSDASYEQALLAAANGASSITHTYNAMRPLKHRENGMVGLALRLHDLYSEIICDCNHSTPDALHIFFNAKDTDKAVMISDSLMCKGFAAGERFMFGGHEIEIYPDGSAHLVEEKNLAGSTMRMNEGLRNLVEKALVPFDKAISSCTVNPARLLRLDDHIGRICAGFDADLVVLNDDYSVNQTYCRGRASL